MLCCGVPLPEFVQNSTQHTCDDFLCISLKSKKCSGSGKAFIWWCVYTKSYYVILKILHNMT